MIVSNPKPKPAPPAPKPEAKKEPPGMTHEQLCDLAAELKPVVTVTVPPRLNEWVFTVKRDHAGQISTIQATGRATKGLTKP